MRALESCCPGAAFKEAVHINGGLLALGNVIVALSGGHEDGPEAAEGDRSAVLNTGGSVAARSSAKKHIPYRWACRCETGGRKGSVGVRLSSLLPVPGGAAGDERLVVSRRHGLARHMARQCDAVPE